MWKILDGIPVVGHVKGIVHYATGDVEAGNKAMKESTRSSAVIGAGAVGFVGGPAGSMLAGASVGAIWDSVESIATGEGTGVVAGIENIVETASKGEVPVSGILQTTLTVTGDVLGGLGGGSIVGSVTQATGQVATNTVGKTVGKSAGETILKSASVPAGETFGKAAAQSVGKEIGKGVGKEVGKEVGKSVTKSAAKQIVKTVVIEETTTIATYGATRALVNETETILNDKGGAGNAPSNPSPNPPPSSRQNSGNTSRTGSQASQGTGTSAGGSGQQPPQQNNQSQTTTQQESVMDIFLAIFGVESLDQIVIQGRAIFSGLYRRQRLYLRDYILEPLRERGMLRGAIEIARSIMNNVEEEEVTYVNFLSLLEFIQQFLKEQMARLNERQQSSRTFDECRREIVSTVGTQLQNEYIARISSLFRDLGNEIRRFTLPVNFRNIFASIYHYFKHRIIGSQELSVPQYYRIAKDNLDWLTSTQQFRDFLVNGGSLTYARYYADHGRRFFIKITRHGERVDLASCFFQDEICVGDEDGDIYINGQPYVP